MGLALLVSDYRFDLGKVVNSAVYPDERTIAANDPVHYAANKSVAVA
jgi:hypothetical protein